MKTEDDYKWENYTKEYAHQIKDEVAKENTLIVNNVVVKEDDVVFHDVPPVHNNWAEVYYQVHMKRVKSVFECGCGSGQHLYNISKISPHVDINGAELLESQIQFGKEYFGLPKEIYEKVSIMDFSMKDAYKSINKKFDFVYTQAVIMHLNNEKAFEFIKNMVQISNKYIFLVEGSGCHDYEGLIRKACQQLNINCTIQRSRRYINYGILVTIE